MNFALIGGDMRQAKLAELLSYDGHKVSAFAMDKIELSGDIKQNGNMTDTLQRAECVILPLPALQGNYINSPLSNERYELQTVLDNVSSKALICAGMINDYFEVEVRKRNLKFVDFFDREELVVSNAVSTAEGAIEIVIKEMPINICSCRCLVMGFGRIGKILANRLKGLAADVTVSARKPSDFAWIEAYGYNSVHTKDVADVIENFDVIINTIPMLVLSEKELKKISSGSMLLDLASKPGGVDFDAAAMLGVRAIWALGLPGKVSPIGSGTVIQKTIYNILREQGSL